MQTVLANSLIASMFLSQLSKHCNIVPRFMCFLYMRLLWPIHFWFVNRHWKCCVCCGAHSRRFKYKHVFATYKPYPFDLGVHWVRILYLIYLVSPPCHRPLL